MNSYVIEDWIQLYQLDIYQAQSVRCDAKSLEDALIKCVMVTPEEVIIRTLDPVAAVGSRDALAKF
ncbi:hypothetical protein AAHE18_04G061600 [Arachis hypogaea]